MSETTATSTTAASPSARQTGVLARVLREGYGPGAWHGPDLRAALESVTPAEALWRPGPGRHNIAEVAIHHAFYVRSVAGRLTGEEQPAFPFAGEDWFEVNDDRSFSWPKITGLLEQLQERLVAAVGDIEGGQIQSPLSDTERLDVVLGITCHAVYHAGQIQLIKALGT